MSFSFLKEATSHRCRRNLIPDDLEFRKGLTSADLFEHLGFTRRTDDDLRIVVLAHEGKAHALHLVALVGNAREQTDPAAQVALVALDEAEAAEPVVDRLALVDLDRKRIVLGVRHDDVRPRVDGCMRDLDLEIEDLAAVPHVVRRDDDVRFRLEVGNVPHEFGEIARVAPGEDDGRRRAVGARPSLCRRADRPCRP
jgi:hypothetical protein